MSADRVVEVVDGGGVIRRYSAREEYAICDVLPVVRLPPKLDGNVFEFLNGLSGPPIPHDLQVTVLMGSLETFHVDFRYYFQQFMKLSACEVYHAVLIAHFLQWNGLYLYLVMFVRDRETNAGLKHFLVPFGVDDKSQPRGPPDVWHWRNV